MFALADRGCKPIQVSDHFYAGSWNSRSETWPALFGNVRKVSHRFHVDIDFAAFCLNGSFRERRIAAKTASDRQLRAESVMRRATLPIVGVGLTVGGVARYWLHVAI